MSSKHRLAPSGFFRSNRPRRGPIAWSAAALGAATIVVACSPAAVEEGPGDAAGMAGKGTVNGAGKGGTAGASAGTGASGGSLSPGGGAGKATGGDTGGAGLSGGQAGSGGASTAGKGGMSGGRGGEAGTSTMSMAGGGMSTMGGRAGASGASGTAGAGGAAGAAGTSGGKAAADPSAGCGKANPQVGSSGSPLMVSSHQYYVKLPAGYDASKPFPVVFMFNPTGNPISWAEDNAGFEKNGAKDGAIRVYPHPQNSSNGWGSGDVSFFEPLYQKVVGDYCVDQARMFAGGESSGGDFVSILGCEHADKLRAVAPCATKDVSGYPLDASKRKCTGQVTATVIHGKNDNVVGPENGPKTRDFYVALNHCMSTSMPIAGYTDTLSNCVEFQGCDAGYPTQWCQHTDPEYSNTNHGWPHFAADYLWKLWSSY